MNGDVRWFRTWQVFNAAMLLIGFFAPWFIVGTSGLLLTYLMAVYSVAAITSGSHVITTLWILLKFVGGVAVLLYAIGNLAWSSNKLWRISTLTLGMIGIGILGSIDLLFAFQAGTLVDVQFGYWLTLVGLMSSVALEIYANSFAQKRRQVFR